MNRHVAYVEFRSTLATVRRAMAHLYSVAVVLFLLALVVAATMGLRIAIWLVAFH